MRAPLFALPILVLTFAPLACDSGGTDSHDTHDSHGSGTDGDSGDPGTMLVWETGPGATVAANSDVEVSFMVHTSGDLHVAEVRACAGEVTDCGGGGAETFDESFPAMSDGTDLYAATINLAAGTWTVVAYAHVGPDPHTSDGVTVTSE